jgi:hypothetical protein
MSEQYTVDYFIKKFEAIPDNKWITHAFIRYNGTACALDNLALEHMRCSIPGINDYSDPILNGMPFMKEHGPRGRILGFLKFVKNKINSPIKEEEKILPFPTLPIKEKQLT